MRALPEYDKMETVSQFFADAQVHAFLHYFFDS